MLSHKFLANHVLCIPTHSGSKAIPQLLVFPSTWKCWQEFSATMSIKSKNKNRLASTSHYFRCEESTVAPRINLLVQKKKKNNATVILIGLQ